MISLSTVVWKIDPLASSSSRSWAAFTRFAVVRDRNLAAPGVHHKGWAFFAVLDPVVEYRTCPMARVPLELAQRIRRKDLGRQVPCPYAGVNRLSEPLAETIPALSWPAVLQGEEAVIGKHRGIVVAECRENAAFM